MAFHAENIRQKNRKRDERKPKLETEMNFSSFSILSAESLNCFYEIRKLLVLIRNFNKSLELFLLFE